MDPQRHTDTYGEERLFNQYRISCSKHAYVSEIYHADRKTYIFSYLFTLSITKMIIGLFLQYI